MLLADLPIKPTWKPLFRALMMAGWQVTAEHPQVHEWLIGSVLELQRESFPGYQRVYLSFFSEEEWCGNNRSRSGFCIAGFGKEFPQSMQDAEGVTLPLHGRWEEDLDFLVQELEHFVLAAT